MKKLKSKYNFISKQNGEKKKQLILEKKGNYIEVETKGHEFRAYGQSIYKISKTNISTDLVLLLLGGKWPDFNGFNWSAVSHFQIYQDELVPCDGFGEFLPGPNLKLIMSDLDLMW